MLAPRRLPIGTCATCPSCSGPATSCVGNDTKVIPAQLNARRGDARIGITLDRPEEDGSWIALARNARRLRAGDDVIFDAGLRATVQARAEDGSIRLRFNLDGADFAAALQEAGALALPPYIAGRTDPSPRTRGDYQTIFARQDGSVAAPTAGLHFTPALLGALDDARDQAGDRHAACRRRHLPAGADRGDRRAPHARRARRDQLLTRRGGDQRRAAGGGASLRSAPPRCGCWKARPTKAARLGAFAGETDIFITPGYRFRAADVLLTNFHLPRSTLFMLVCAFAGTERMRAAYAHAIDNGYRFYSYGDACLI